MPSKKNGSGSKKRSYKTTTNKRRSIYYQDARKKDKPEKKWFDVPGTLVPPIGSAFVVTPANLTAIASGTTASNKIGSKVQLKSVHVRANAIFGGGQVSTSPSQVRYVIVYDKAANNAVPSRNDVFADGTLWNSDFNGSNQDRFICLADVISEQCTNGQFNVTTNIFRKMDLEARGAAGATIFNSGNIWMFVAANADWNSASTANVPDVQFYSRVKFTDA